MATMEVEGVVRLFVDVSVTLEDMKTWSPDRIASFFDGLAKVRLAASPIGDRVVQTTRKEA